MTGTGIGCCSGCSEDRDDSEYKPGGGLMIIMRCRALKAIPRGHVLEACYEMSCPGYDPKCIMIGEKNE